MNAREVIQKALLACIRRGTGKPWQEVIISELSTAGFTIMSKEDVEAVRDKALEEAASICDRFAARDMHPAECSAAIRSLKSGGRE